MPELGRLRFAAVAVLVGAVVVACGGSDAAPSSPVASGSVERAVAAANTWTIEPGVRLAGVSAPATLRLADGTFRTYLPGLEVVSSPDGITFGARRHLALAEEGAFLRNPAVTVLPDGTFVMIFEAVTDERGPSRATRFYRATSRDGIEFAKTPGGGTGGAVLEPLASDRSFISAPDLVLLPGGDLRLYFNAADGTTIESARSKDAGLTWQREGAVTVEGLGGRRAADPDVLLLRDGTYWLFFAAGREGSPEPHILSATSADGLHFRLEPNEALSGQSAGTYRVDPEVVDLGNGNYRLYFADASSAAGPYAIRSATLSR